MAKKDNIIPNNTRLSKSRQNQIEYWSKRAENNFLAGEKDALEVAKGLSTNYRKAIREIENKINRILWKICESK